MAPDLNFLPPSRPIPPNSPGVMRTVAASSPESAALHGQGHSPSPRSTSTSLQAAAAVNAGLQYEELRRSSSGSNSRNRQPSYSSTGRRRSIVLMNLQIHDPTLPAPGEIISEGFMTSSTVIPSGAGNPHHLRTPSLGETHQSIDEDQESQVNRLLQMIRTQQQQFHQAQSSSGQHHLSSQTIDESIPTPERSLSFSTPNYSHSSPRSPTAAIPRSSFDLARIDLQHRRSKPSSITTSPRMRSSSISGESGESWTLGGRDENAFHQAGTQMMVRENQILRQRIRELERQVNELSSNSLPHDPVIPSRLLRSESISDNNLETVPDRLAVASTRAAIKSVTPESTKSAAAAAGGKG